MQTPLGNTYHGTTMPSVVKNSTWYLWQNNLNILTSRWMLFFAFLAEEETQKHVSQVNRKTSLLGFWGRNHWLKKIYQTTKFEGKSHTSTGKICGDKGINEVEIHRWKSSGGSEQSRWLVITISLSTVPKICCCVIKTEWQLCVCANSCVCMLGSSLDVFFFQFL